jgi:hypothetical protein
MSAASAASTADETQRAELIREIMQTQGTIYDIAGQLKKEKQKSAEAQAKVQSLLSLRNDIAAALHEMEQQQQHQMMLHQQQQQHHGR